MSYSFTIAGHSPNPHNDDVAKIAVEAVRKLKALEGSVSLTGYTYDQSAVNKQLDDVLVAEFETLDAPEVVSAQVPEVASTEPLPLPNSTESEPIPPPAEA